MTNRSRVRINEEANRILCPADYVTIEPTDLIDGNMPQFMRIWKGIILMARVKGTSRTLSEKQLKNAMRYQVVNILKCKKTKEVKEFNLAEVNDRNEHVSDVFMMAKEEVRESMRLTHAFTYYS